jgi:glycosyltransferase involved in cell wall biosynthesis
LNNLHQISVVIPFYNRLEALQMTLNHLGDQTLPDELFEVIIVNDGSGSGLRDLTASLDLALALTVLCQDHKGPAAARNLGAANARGEILLFLDADMLADPKLLAIHLEAHKIHHRALVEGLRKIHLTPHTPLFMQIIDVDTNPVKTPVDFPEMLTCNLSIKKSDFLELGGFKEQLIRWQDVEFGYRAKRADFKLIHVPEAVAYHEHPMSFEQFCEKQKEHHRLAWRFFELHPGVVNDFNYLSNKLPIDLSNDSPGLLIKKIARSLLASRQVLGSMEQMTTFFENYKQPKNILQFLYWKIISCYQWIGLHQSDKPNEFKNS